MVKPVHGFVRGKTIELTEEPGLADGLEVEVLIQAVPPKQPWGEGLLRCAGALADQWPPQDDQILETIYHERRRDSRKEGKRG